MLSVCFHHSLSHGTPITAGVRGTKASRPDEDLSYTKDKDSKDGQTKLTWVKKKKEESPAARADPPTLVKGAVTVEVVHTATAAAQQANDSPAADHPAEEPAPETTAAIAWWRHGVIPALVVSGITYSLMSSMWNSIASSSSYIQDLQSFKSGKSLGDANYTEASMMAAKQIVGAALRRARRAVTLVPTFCVCGGTWAGAQAGRIMQSLAQPKGKDKGNRAVKAWSTLSKLGKVCD